MIIKLDSSLLVPLPIKQRALQQLISTRDPCILHLIWFHIILGHNPVFIFGIFNNIALHN